MTHTLRHSPDADSKSPWRRGPLPMLDPLIVARMKKVRTERIALVTSGVGMALMILTTVWRVNPVEGSVSLVPESLEGNPFGEALMYVLLVTCMPVWIPTVFSVVVLAGPPESDSLELANGAAVIVQGIVYFMLGKLISGWAKRFRTKRNRTQARPRSTTRPGEPPPRA